MRSGRFVRAAISLTDRAEVLVARMSSGGQTRSSSWKIAVFELQVVGHGLDHELGRLQGPEGVHGADAGQDRLLLRLRAPPLGDVVVEALDDLGHGRLRRLRRALADQHVEAGGRAGDGDALPHRARAHDPDRPHDHGASMNSVPSLPMLRNFS